MQVIPPNTLFVFFFFFPFYSVFLTVSNKQTQKKLTETEEENEETESNVERGFDVRLNTGIEVSEGIISIGIELALFVDVVLVEFFADFIDSE